MAKIILRVGALLSLVSILVLSLVPGEYRPHTMILTSGLEHVAAYMVAAFLLCLTYYGRLSPVRIVLILTAYGALLELAQLWIPGRHGQSIDIFADFLGAAIGVSVASALARRIPCAIAHD